MALPKTLVGQKLTIQLGDGGSPSETFAAVCGMLNATVTFTASVQETAVPDCASPDNPAAVFRDIDTISFEVSGDGILDTGSFESILLTWFLTGAEKNCRIKFDATGANGGGYVAGPMLLTSLEASGQRKQKATASMTLVSAGAFSWTDAS